MTGTAMLVHALPEAGKTTFGLTAPGPRLFLDVDRGTRAIPNRVLWDPNESPPTDAETVIIPACNLEKVNLALQWLQTGQHPFRSVILDTVTALQRQGMLELVGTRKPEWDDWGSILRFVEKPLADLTGLVEHPKRPLECVIINSHTREVMEKDDRGNQTDVVAELEPYLQGQVGDILPWYVDITGYLKVEKDETRSLLFKMPGTNNGKRRFPQLPDHLDNPTVGTILSIINQKDEA